MTATSDFLNFINAKNSPTWYRFAIREVLRDSDKRATDLAQEIIDRFPRGNSQFGGPLKAEEIPGGNSIESSLHLEGIYDVKGINALKPTAPLTFAKQGLTLIYGENGSGKSGYARILKSAIGSIDSKRDDAILGNVFSNSTTKPTATIKYVLNGKHLEWKYGIDEREKLSKARFFNRDCGNFYVSKNSEINYQPLVVTLLIRLVEVADAVAALLDNKIDQQKRSIDEIWNASSLNKIEEDTNASRKLKALLSQDQFPTSPSDIPVFTPKEQTQLAKYDEELRKLELSDPEKERKAKQESISEILRIKERLSNVEELASEKYLIFLSDELSKLRSRSKAAKDAAKLRFSNDPLPGIGSDSWRILWRAAEQFAQTELNFSGNGVPSSQEDRCVLCQQPLQEEASQRLQRFYQFVTDRSSEQLSETQANVKKQIQRVDDGLQNIEVLKPILEKDNLKQLLGDELFQKLQKELQALETALLKISKGLDSLEQSQFQCIRLSFHSSQLQTLAENIRIEIEEIDDQTFKSQLKALKAKIIESKGQKLLVDSLDSVEKIISLNKIKSQLEEQRKTANTRRITTTKNNILDVVAKEDIQQLFEEIAEKLRVVPYARMEKTKAGKNLGYTQHPILVDAIQKANVNEVLSEGEQIALGLAGFLTEALYPEDQTTLIFDDPVTSMDAKRRYLVAKLLLEISKERQVIVFTHDKAFVAEIIKISGDLGQEVTPLTVQRRGNNPGEVTENFSWDLRDSKKRANSLREDFSALKKDFNSITNEDFRERVGELAGKLSTLWERAAVEFLASPLLDISTLEVHPALIRIYPQFSEDDLADFNQGYNFASKYTYRHESLPQKYVETPDINELEMEINRVKCWIKRVAGYKK